MTSAAQRSPSGGEHPNGGSVLQLSGGGGVYLPDYSVRQLTPLQIIKVGTEIGPAHLHLLNQ